MIHSQSSGTVSQMQSSHLSVYPCKSAGIQQPGLMLQSSELIQVGPMDHCFVAEEVCPALLLH